MSNDEIKLIQYIRNSDNPQKTLEYIEYLLINPQKVQEALAALSAQRGA